MTIYFYDSYAVIEYMNDNSRFVSYFEEHTGMLSLLNVLEVYYSVLSDAGKEKADIVLDTLWPLIVIPSKDSVKQAMEFRREHKKSNVSYANCLGYVLALQRGVKFLTGDIQFRSLKNVEFVK